jgi:hypothetical protein
MSTAYCLPATLAALQAPSHVAQSHLAAAAFLLAMLLNRMGSHEEMGEHTSAASFTPAAPDMCSSAKALTAAAAMVAHTAAHSMLPSAVLCCGCVASRC